MINWQVRLKSRSFWVGVIGALGTAAVAVCGALGVDFDAAPWVSALTSVVTGVFGILALVGVAVDPTTEGVGDSERALGYEEPAKRIEGEAE